MASHILGEIRRFETPRFTVIVDALSDDSCIDDLASEPEDQQAIADRLDSGELILFCARARVMLDGTEIASDYLGGCVYESLDAFMDHRAVGRQNREHEARGEPSRCGSYFHDMIRTVCDEARDEVRRLQSVRVRA